MWSLIFLMISSAFSQSDLSKSRTSKRAVDFGGDGRSSLVFVFDTTGSMYNDLKQLREGAEMILNTALEASDIIADFVFVPFHDPLVGPATVTNDTEVFKSALNIVHVYGGGDCPEKSLGGIQMALNVSRPRSFLYVFTDATAGDHKLVGKVLDAIQRKQSQVVFVLTGHCNDLHKPSYKVYQQIAAASSGQIFNLNKTSVHEVLDFVRSAIKGRTVNLGSVVKPAGYNFTQEIPIDSTVGEVTVSVSGAKPQIRVVNPSGQELTGPPKLVKILDLSKIMVVKVLDPEPGNWSITVGSEQDYSVKVLGLSNLTFDHGFSVEPPTSMAETSYRPLRGAYNHMMLSLSGTDKFLDMKYVEVLNLAGETMFEVPLREFDRSRHLYLSEAFVPPDDFFLIAINGRDEFNQEIRRVGATAVQAKTPDVPYLTTVGSIEAQTHINVLLKCNVESLVPVTAKWVKDTIPLQPDIASLQTTSIEYTITDMSEAHIGTYTCVAKNVAGESKAVTEVMLIVELPEVSIDPGNITLEFGDEAIITCTVISEALLSKFQLIFNKNEDEYVTDINVEPNLEGYYTFVQTIHNITDNDAGLYTCLAANRGGEMYQSLYVSVKAQPVAQMLGPRPLTVSCGADIHLMCYVENAELVQWIASNGSVVVHRVNGSDTDILDVENVTEDGIWRCVALRDGSSAADAVELNVLTKPKVSIMGSNNITVLNGTVHELVCEVQARPAPNVVWERGLETFSASTKLISSSPDVYRNVLSLNSSMGDISGKYICSAENSEGRHEEYVTVNVRRKMSLIQGFSDVSVELYFQVELQCQVDAYPQPRIRWYHNSTQLSTTNNVHLSEDGAIVYIKMADFDDLGSYTCIADNGFETVYVNGTLSVFGLEFPSISKEVDKYIVRKGDTIAIACRVTKGKPEPSVTWKYRSNNSTEFSNLPEGLTIDESDGVFISNAGLEHAGVYRCIVDNVLGIDTHDIQLIVQFPPSLEFTEEHSLEKTREVKVGEKVEFSCHAAGFPPPIVLWKKNGQPVPFSRNVHLTDANDLVIESASRHDSGIFTCNATSFLGSVQRNFTLYVYVPPVISQPAGELSYETLEGQLVELPCAADGEPRPQVYWTHNGNDIKLARIHTDEFGIRFVANLTDFGNYTCTAVSEYGNTSVTYSLYVWVTPYIEPPLEVTIDVLAGDNVTISCNAVGFPLPEIVWEFQEDALLENTTDIGFNDRGNLFINNVNFKHEGVYNCIAENLVGIARKSVYIKINEPPKIIEDDFTGPYMATNMDATVTLACRVSGRPRPYIFWSKDGQILNNDFRYESSPDGTLTIKSPTEEESGNYTCNVRNNYRTVYKFYELIIFSVPRSMRADETPPKMTFLEGSNATIHCPVEASATDTVKWYKDALLIAIGTFQITNISRSDSSTYACVVSNMAGSGHASVTVNVEWMPEFGLKGSGKVEAIEGEDVYFDCQVDAKPAAKIKWLFNSKRMLSQDETRLKLISVQQHHVGVYRCIASNDHGTIVREFSLDVMVPPRISEFDSLDVLLKEGTDATLECNAKGIPQPSIKWTYNNTNWHLDNSTLTSSNITSLSEGVYRCDAMSKAGAAHLVYRVEVVTAAKITDIISFKTDEGVSVDGIIEVVVNTRVRISCQATGKPTPTIQWLRNGRMVGVNQPDVFYADLILDSIQTIQAGGYSCIASNEGGYEGKKIKINVLEPPKIFQELFQNANVSQNYVNIEVISGQAFYLHCHPYGNPLPEVYWYKDDQPLQFIDDTIVSNDFGEVLVAKSAMEEQSGNYTCVARNNVGNYSISYLVQVLVPPAKPKESLKKLVTVNGKEVILSCPVVGTPLPEVIWIKHPYTEITADTPRMVLGEDNFTLIINNTEVSDSGSYSCIMTNIAGTTEVVFRVLVQQPPRIVSNKGNSIENHVVALWRSVILKCEVEGYPAPKITWLKDTQQLSDKHPNIHRVLGNSLLVIWSVSSRDAGQYICVGTNEAGAQHRRFNVAIKVPGKWSVWDEWSTCNVSCGPGYQFRKRFCQYIDKNNNIIDNTTQSDKVVLDLTACKGSANEKRKCHMPPCEDDVNVPKWSSWSKWSACSATCGIGTQARTRKCKSKVKCTGDNVQIRKCPDIPKCEREPGSNEVFDSKEDVNGTSRYLPDAVFEMEPEMIGNSRYMPGGSDFFIPAPKKSPVYDVNVTENLDRSERGPCHAGFTYNLSRISCDDIDECLLDNNHCHSTQVCMNTEGAYQCTCSPGYVSLGLGQRCLDVNECEQEIHGCEYACVNVAGGYVCACPQHLRLHLDKHHCVNPSLYQRPVGEYEVEEFIGTSVNSPVKYTKNDIYVSPNIAQ